MRDRKRTYGQPAISQWLGRRKALRRFPPFFMNNSEYRSLLNNKKYETENVKFVRNFKKNSSIRRAEAYRYALTSKYIFYTQAFNWIGMSRKNQLFVDLWHGCGYKANKKNILDEIRVQGEDLLRQMGLGDRMNNYPHQLSGGMRQRVCIASALVTPKELLIADEPCTALDVTIQDQIHHLLRVLVEEKKRSLIMITHSLGVARELVDRIYIMYGGNIVETCRTEDLFKSPSHPYTQGLLSCVPRLSGGGLSAGIYGYVPYYVNPPEGCRFAPRCPYATEICKKKRPPVVEIESEHKVACFRYADGKTEKEGAE